MRIAALMICAALLSGCSWFGGNKEEVIKPAELQPIRAQVQIVPIWDRRLGDKANDRASALRPALDGGRIFAASADGNVVAMAPGGRPVWDVNVRDLYTPVERANVFAKRIDAITGGVAAGSDLVVVGTSAGEIVALNQSDGSLAWRARSTSEVLAPVGINRDFVIAQSIDGKVAAYDVLDGARRWVYSTAVPSLTLRGTTTPIVTADAVITGFANGRMVVLDLQRGLAGIDQRVALAQGKTDLERLIDIDGRIMLDGYHTFVASYQGSLMAMDLNDGRPLWAVDASSTAGLAGGFGNVYLAAADGSLIAYDTGDGDEVWQNDSLKHRDLTTPTTISSYLAVGDLEGYLHVLAQSDGRFVGRRKVDSDPLRSPPVVDGSRLYVQTQGGRLLALELR